MMLYRTFHSYIYGDTFIDFGF